MEYISNLRIEHAKRMLQTEEMAIQDIAKAVGFKSSYYFCSVFKRKNRLHAHRLRPGILLEAHISRSGNGQQRAAEVLNFRGSLATANFCFRGRRAGKQVKGLPPTVQ